MITEYTHSQEKALHDVIAGADLLLSGKPGTGKTELIRDIAERQGALGKKVLMTASTGLAASNLDGCRTIHSTLHWNPRAEYFNVDRCCDALSEADILIIDEVSMLTPCILNHLTNCLQHVNKPIQKILSGDFFQLPPVNPGMQRVYPFETNAWRYLNLTPCFLDEVVRQRDPEFKHQLELAMLANPTCITYFNEESSQRYIDGAITLCTVNKDADSINERKMSVLSGYGKTFDALGNIAEANFSDSRIEKCFIAKIGMRVMALRNDVSNRYQNGSLGTVVDMEDNEITVLFDNGNIVEMQRISYEVENVDRNKGMVTVEQFPLRGGYAITIHKSQGQTFDSINIKAPRCWDPGQLYVALSRARSIEGIHLMNPIDADSLITDPRVVNFYNSLREGYAAA